MRLLSLICVPTAVVVGQLTPELGQAGVIINANGGQETLLDPPLAAPSSSSSCTDPESCVSDETPDTKAQILSEEPVNKAYYETDEAGHKRWVPSPYTLNEFHVAGGVNLAQYKLGSPPAQPFYLLNEWSLASLLTGNESWKDLMEYRQELMEQDEHRVIFEFYQDQVALKRWLPTSGFETVRWYALKYLDVFVETDEDSPELVHLSARRVQELLPAKAKFLAKPSLSTETTFTEDDHGDWWRIQYDIEGNTTFVSQGRPRTALSHNNNVVYNEQEVAESLAGSLMMNSKNNNGLVVEELLSHPYDRHAPPMEFRCYLIWGRLWVAQWLAAPQGSAQDVPLWVLRDGKLLETPDFPSQLKKQLPDWIDWDSLVYHAERFASNKDFVRVDIITGVPANVEFEHLSVLERKHQVRNCFSAIHLLVPPEHVKNEALLEEGARLWIAGYKIGHYRTVENFEVPREFVETGRLSERDASEYYWPVQMED